jgi:hypothetical protein
MFQTLLAIIKRHGHLYKEMLYILVFELKFT